MRLCAAGFARKGAAPLTTCASPAVHGAVRDGTGIARRTFRRNCWSYALLGGDIRGDRCGPASAQRRSQAPLRSDRASMELVSVVRCIEKQSMILERRSMTMTIQVLIADPHPAIRAGVRSTLGQAPDIQIAAEGANSVETLHFIKVIMPDVALIECWLPDIEDGIAVVREVHAQKWPTRIIIYTNADHDPTIHVMVQAGIAGYIFKDEPLETICEAVRAVSRGQCWFRGPIVTKLATWIQGKPGAHPELAALTDREQQVLRLLARGWDNLRIAATLNLKLGTVKNHVSRIYDKVSVHTRAEAVAYAYRHGIVEEPPCTSVPIDRDEQGYRVKVTGLE